MATLDEVMAEAARRGLVRPQQAGLGQQVKEFFLGDDDPNTQNLGEKIGSALNKAGESMTMGLIGDEASAAAESLMPGVDYDGRRDHYRQQEEVLERDNPGVALTADVGGALALPGGALAKAGGSLVKRALLSGVTTGAAGGTYGFMEGEGGVEARAEGAEKDGVLSAGIGAAIPFAGAGVKRIADALANRGAVKAATRGAPSTDALRRQGQAAYEAIDNAGVSINPAKVREGLGGIADALRGEGAAYTGAEKVLPASRAIMEAAEDVGARANSVPWKELDVFRRYMGNAAGANPANRADTRNATNALSRLDDFVQGLGPNDVDAGDIEALQELLPKARDLWSRMSRSQTIDDAIEAAGNYQSGAASGLRNQFRRILNSPKLSRGFSDAERKMMQKVVNGGIGDVILHYLGGGLGMMGTMGGGAALGGLPGFLAGAGVAAGARKLSERSTGKKAEVVRALIANGGLPALPGASPAVQQITEQLLRRGTAAGVQN